MARDYYLSKKLSHMQINQVEQEIKQISNVKMAAFMDSGYIEIETKDNDFQEVMTIIANILRRVCDGCELSFAKIVV